MSRLSYARHRFPPAIIQHAVWLYFRFALSYRDVEDMFAEPGIDVSCETARRRVLKSGRIDADRIRRQRPRPSDRRSASSHPTPPYPATSTSNAIRSPAARPRPFVPKPWPAGTRSSPTENAFRRCLEPQQVAGTVPSQGQISVSNSIGDDLGQGMGCKSLEDTSNRFCAWVVDAVK